VARMILARQTCFCGALRSLTIESGLKARAPGHYEWQHCNNPESCCRVGTSPLVACT
jgi:hypothetical protein